MTEGRGRRGHGRSNSSRSVGGTISSRGVALAASMREKFQKCLGSSYGSPP